MLQTSFDLRVKQFVAWSRQVVLLLQSGLFINANLAVAKRLRIMKCFAFGWSCFQLQQRSPSSPTGSIDAVCFGQLALPPPQNLASLTRLPVQS